ncbi:hypothetical protein ACIQGZ_01675 [Streptomyces sp. NPDC092296]|uniref:hypothetical protein n=1 Tax=Streptomyces sp. NPDC092296 TaxID=3366012 RepID=UPI003811DB7C
MAYIVTLPAGGLNSIREKLRIEQRLTKALPKEVRPVEPSLSRPMVLLLSATTTATGQRIRHLMWLGIVAQHNTVGAVDWSITVDPLRECMETIPLDGHDGLLSRLSAELRSEFEQASQIGAVGMCSHTLWEAIDGALRAAHPGAIGLLDWLAAQANPPVLDSSDAADRSWQEQQDATRSVVRISEFPLSALAAWQRPPSRHDPYLAGLIPQPVEHSLIDHDVRASGEAFGLFSEWEDGVGTRCDVHVLRDASGRYLEVANVNATPIESRFGTDMIYYHEPTMSFTFVQYKRLESRKRSIRVDERLRSQLDRLDEVAKLSTSPSRPSDWRLGSDPCFLKLAYWPRDPESFTGGLTPGMYLPVSYVRLLLEDDCTRGREGSEARLLGYDQVERHLVSTQFVELVKHGLAGTVGTTAEQLRDLVQRRVSAGHSVVVATEFSEETTIERQRRTRSRASKAQRYSHKAQKPEPLFELD